MSEMVPGTEYTKTHIFRSSRQEATRFAVCGFDPPMYINHSDQCRLPTDCCYKARWAKNLWAFSYYDCTKFICKDGKGCKK